MSHPKVEARTGMTLWQIAEAVERMGPRAVSMAIGVSEKTVTTIWRENIGAGGYEGVK